MPFGHDSLRIPLQLWEFYPILLWINLESLYLALLHLNRCNLASCIILCGLAMQHKFRPKPSQSPLNKVLYDGVFMTSAIETPLQAAKMFESPKPWSPKAQSYSGNSIRSKFTIKIVQTLCLILNFDKVKLFASNKRSQAAMIQFLYETYVCMSSVPPGGHPQFEDAREVDASLPHDVWLYPPGTEHRF